MRAETLDIFCRVEFGTAVVEESTPSYHLDAIAGKADKSLM